MKRAAAYTRFSSDMQSQDSTEAQLDEIKRYCNSNNIDIVKIYSDEAITGKTDNRPAFQEMIQDAKKGYFDVVVVHKVDRFARDRYDSAIHKAQLKRLGIGIQYAGQAISDNAEGRLMEGILESFAQYYSENLANETMKGLKLKARRAEFNGGIPPLGYDIKNKKYIINEYEANIVKIIFDLYSSGKSYGEIINILNKKGFKSKSQNPFTKNSLHSIITNEKYIGVYTFNKTAPRVYGKRNSHKTKNNDEIIRLDGGVPAIVDKETWALCQKRLKHNKDRKGQYKAKVPYLLTGLIYCECGTPMNGDKKVNNYKTEYYYYRCRRCNNIISKYIVEEYVLSQLYETYFTDKAIPQISKLINDYLKRTFVIKDDKIQNLKNDLKRVDVEIKNVINAITSIGISEALGEKLKDLEICKKDMNMELLSLQNEINLHLFTTDEIESMLEKYKAALINKDISECQKFIDKFIRKVVIFKDKIKIYYSLDYFTKNFKSVVSDGVDSTAPIIRSPEKLAKSLQGFFFIFFT